MARTRPISSTLFVVLVLAIAPIVMQHCVMAESILPRLLACENERPVEPPCHDDEAPASVEVCCEASDPAIIDEAVVTARVEVELPPVVEAISLEPADHGYAVRLEAPDTGPPTPDTALNVLYCTYLC